MIPRSAANTCLILIVVAVVRFSAWFYFGAGLDVAEIWSALGLGAVWAVLYPAMPSATKEWLDRIISTTLRSPLLTRRLLFSVALVLFPFLILSRVVIHWEGADDIRLFWNARKHLVLRDGRHASPKTAIVVAPNFMRYSFICGTFRSHGRMWPFVGAESRIPALYICSQRQLQNVEEELVNALLIYRANRFIGNAVSNLTVFAAPEETQGLAKTRFETVAETLRLSLVTKDPRQTQVRMAESYSERYTDDTWANILRASAFYSCKNYTNALNALGDGPFFADLHCNRAARFFRAACLYYADDYTNALAMLERLRSEIPTPESSLDENTLSSVLNYEGIIQFRQRSYEEAAATCLKAESIPVPDLKCRALANAGSVRLIQGRIAEAETILAKSKEYGPYGEVNYAYVLLAKGDTNLARANFVRLANDNRLRADDPDNIYEARAMVALITDQGQQPREFALNEYEAVLSDLGVSPYRETESLELRFAHAYYQTAAKLYMSRLRGLQVIAYELFARAFFDLDHHLSANPNDQAARKMRDAVQMKLRDIKEELTPGWQKAVENSNAFRATRLYLSEARSQKWVGP